MGPKVLTTLRAERPETRGLISPRKWTTNSVQRQQHTSTRRKWSTLSIDTSRPKTRSANNLEEIERNQLITMKLAKFWVAATSLPFKMPKKWAVCRRILAKQYQCKRWTWVWFIKVSSLQIFVTLCDPVGWKQKFSFQLCFEFFFFFFCR